MRDLGLGAVELISQRLDSPVDINHSRFYVAQLALAGDEPRRRGGRPQRNASVRLDNLAVQSDKTMARHVRTGHGQGGLQTFHNDCLAKEMARQSLQPVGNSGRKVRRFKVRRFQTFNLQTFNLRPLTFDLPDHTNQIDRHCDEAGHVRKISSVDERRKPVQANHS